MEKLFFMVERCGRARLPEQEKFARFGVWREISTDLFNYYFNGLTKVLTTFDEFLTAFDDVWRALLPGRNGFGGEVLFDIKGLSIVATV